MTLRPLCQFCQEEIRPETGDKAIMDDGWCHELCWWKRECARLTALVAELREDCDGASSISQRHARHPSLGSEPTQYGEFEASDLGPPTEAGEAGDD